MEKILEKIKFRISELEEIVASTPVSKSFAAQSRLVEAKYILATLENEAAH